METSIRESKLSDGSPVFAVVFIDGSMETEIAADSEAAALRLQDAFYYDACHATTRAVRASA